MSKLAQVGITPHEPLSGEELDGARRNYSAAMGKAFQAVKLEDVAASELGPRGWAGAGRDPLGPAEKPKERSELATAIRQRACLLAGVL